MKKSIFKQTEIGQIPEDWDVKRASDSIDIIGGGTPKTTVKEYWCGSIPWISVVDFVGDRRWIRDTGKHITQRGVEESSTKILRKGQLIISARGTVGEIGQVAKDMTFNQSCYGLDGKEEFFNDFLYYLLKFKVNEVLSKTHGSVFNTITRQTFEQIQLQHPNLPEQHAIAKVLSDLDSQIEVLQQQNVTLEAIGKALFKHWFVDFEFPNEKGKPYRSSGGAMIDSELGKIPNGWCIVYLPEVADVIDCLHTKKPEQVDKGKILLQFYNLNINNSVDILTPYFISDEDFKVWTKNILVDHRDILFTNVGRQAISKVPFWLNGGIGRNITAVRPKRIEPVYLLRYLLSEFGQDQIKNNLDEGTILSSLNVKGIRKLKILLPHSHLIAYYSELARPLRLKLEINEQESYTLSQIRDSLLPKLMSGKIRVPIPQ